MSILYHGFTGIMLLCSISGYMMLTRKWLKFQTEFVPVFVFSTIGCVVYIGGIFGLLLLTAVFVLAGGIIAFIYYGSQIIKEKEYLSMKISLFQIIFGIGCLIFFHQLFISRLIHYDNFSHWAIALKQVLSTDAFPDARSALIDYKNYPLGTTSFLYFICRFAGHSQRGMLMGQGLLVFACFYALFGVITEKKRFLLYAYAGAGFSTLSIFNLTIRINNLLVDFLLPIYTLAILAISYKYRNELKKSCIAIIPIAGFLMIIKNTGTIFAGIGLIYFLYIAVKSFKQSRIIVVFKVLAAAVASLVPYLLWSLHMSVFFQGIDNKFEVSAEHLQTIYGGKTQEEVRQIVSLYFQSCFDLSTRPAMGIFIFQLTAMAAIIFAAFFLKKKWNLWKALVALDVVTILYYGGILALYIFSMPLDEAIRLAGFERYASSIVVLFAGGLILCSVIDIEHSFYYKMDQVPAYRAFKSVESKDRYQKGTLITLALGITLLLSEYNGMQTINRNYDSTLPYEVEKITGDRWYQGGTMDENKYLFYASDTDSQVTDYYLQYIAKYMLFAPNVDGICQFYEDNLLHLLSSYDYLVMVESDSDSRYLLKKYFGVSGENGIYKIVRTGDTVTLEQT